MKTAENRNQAQQGKFERQLIEKEDGYPEVKIDFSALECFEDFLAGGQPLEAVFNHPAYQIIRAHGQRFGVKIGLAEVEQALRGEDSPFYGLRNLAANLPRIHKLAETIRAQRGVWQAIAEAEIRRLLPEENLDGITIYPLHGYDMGIGMLDTVCMNLNIERYLREPREFLYYLIHEAMHVVYERCHTVEQAALMTTPARQQAYFGLWVQSEGFAVYAPLRLRTENGDLADADYQTLLDPAALKDSLRICHEIRQMLQSDAPLPPDEFLRQIYGSHRVTYRVGCEILRRIEQRMGPQALKAAFLLKGEDFLEQFDSLIALS